MTTVEKLAAQLGIAPDSLVEALGTLTTGEVLELTDHAKKSQKRGRGGDRIRETASALRAEAQVQNRLTAGILGCAAQLAQNNEKLIGEAVEAAEAALPQ